MADLFLIGVTIVMAILIIGINVYLVFYFLEDKTSSVCDWVFKVLCIFGLTIA